MTRLADSIAWLLEPDPINPGVRLVALRDLLDQPADTPELVAAQQTVMRLGTGARDPDRPVP